MTDNIPLAPQGEFVLFTSADGQTRVECRFESDTLWLSQAMIGELYGKAKATISEHIKNIFAEGELDENSVVRLYRTTAADGKSYNVQYFSLRLVLAVGYRVRSSRGTQFRQWATQTLQEYLIKGFVMDDERLKNPPVGHSAVPDYFDDLLERIRDIRASERRVYLRVKEIFTMAADYEPSNQETNRFFQTIQNKLHYACTHMTAAELIASRVDASKPDMGLTSYKGDEVRKTDVTVAKNYLREDEIKELNRIVNMWLDFAEDQALRRKQVFLQDWTDKLDQFLSFNDRDVLNGAGKISKKEADDKAKLEFDRFAAQRRRLKEAEGERANIAALKAILKKDK
ncbi:virulence RhuM family protein [Pectobacterium carotovorum]|uniref:virulence RhuM family protein n=1 Tax=Pectobacterium carotovorum TaxID=554 RepID=UPI00057C7CF5|nr:RhuM family protein [Pectobacterium carotovorum]KHT31636.1 2-hydroxyacid dehydrogenase [Pectobacterium carotovorum subsp. carotovorum]MBA0180847.1 virulence RhuM family protein [Pectobacterium carotovorum]MBA0192903.1 virulence RhuM family protein [Pectobacterium carotovorum]MBA0201951.1 virulence RhuM family protein [Pectobacterium carotovorum]MDY4374489.1 RhuM family protein [Pectobacterium carotovorum subsp. carotovorum]